MVFRLSVDKSDNSCFGKTLQIFARSGESRQIRFLLMYSNPPRFDNPKSAIR